MERNAIVFGATGKTGIQICKALDNKNINFSAFVREQSMNNLDDSIQKSIQGDVLNPLDVAKAFENAAFTDVIIALGSKELKSTDIRSRGTKHIIKAMIKSKTKANIHVISALGIGESWDQLNWMGKFFSKYLIKNAMNDHEEQEKLIKNNPFNYHIIRPVGLRDGSPKGYVHVQNKGIMPSSAIQRADVATYLVESLLENKNGVSGICQKK